MIKKFNEWKQDDRKDELSILLENIRSSENPEAPPISGILTPFGVIGGTSTHIVLLDTQDQSHTRTWEEFRAFMGLQNSLNESK